MCIDVYIIIYRPTRPYLLLLLPFTDPSFPNVAFKTRTTDAQRPARTRTVRPSRVVQRGRICCFERARHGRQKQRRRDTQPYRVRHCRVRRVLPNRRRSDSPLNSAVLVTDSYRPCAIKLSLPHPRLSTSQQNPGAMITIITLYTGIYIYIYKIYNVLSVYGQIVALKLDSHSALGSRPLCALNKEEKN